MNSICVVCESGWILKGNKRESTSEDKVKLSNAAVVRSWRNGKGIGGIAKAENAEEYILDPIGDVDVRASKILFEFPCEW